MNRIFFFWMALFVAMICAFSEPSFAERRFVTLGTAGVNGVYYPVGGTICHLVNRKGKEHGIRCAVESTGGSIYNLQAVRSNELDIGFAQSDWQAHAYSGSGIFTDSEPNYDLRSLFSLHSEALTVVAGKDTDIYTFDDLKGKRVNLGNPGSGMRATVDEVMRAKGWDRDVFRHVSEFMPSEQSQKLCSNQIDAFVFATGHPNGAIQEVVNMCGARLVRVDGVAIEELIGDHKHYARATIPGGMYANNPDNVPTFGVKATLVASKNLDDEVAYQIVKAVFEHFDEFRTTHPILSTLKKQYMIERGLTAPLHSGALRYYREVGLIK